VSFVLDASIAATWAFADESHPQGELAFVRIRSETAFVPSLWWYELRNVLVAGERKDRISPRDSDLFLKRLSPLRIETDRAIEEAALMTLSRTRGLTVYDAAYLELAVRRQLPLATLDRKLRDAAKAEGIPDLGT
jgi:predicted nucleic acid-binding protein